MFKNKEEYNAYMKAWRAKQKELHPQKVRNADRKNHMKWRAGHKEEWQEYSSNYFKEWRSNPLNKVCHGTRATIGCIKSLLKKKPDTKFHAKTLELINSLKSVGWHENLPSTVAVNHKVSLYLLHSFKLDLDRSITCDPINLELIDRVKNNTVGKRRVNREVLRVAKQLIKKYPKELEGFFEFLQDYKGEII